MDSGTNCQVSDRCSFQNSLGMHVAVLGIRITCNCNVDPIQTIALILYLAPKTISSAGTTDREFKSSSSLSSLGFMGTRAATKRRTKTEQEMRKLQVKRDPLDLSRA